MASSSRKEDVSATDDGFSRLMLEYKEALDEMLGDPLLADLSPDITLAELQSRITMELGQAMTIMIKRADGVIYPVIVPLNATVQDLKKEIERYVTLQLTREGEERKSISWRYIWKTYWLVFNGVKLKDLNMMLKDIGLSNRSEVHFIKRLQPK